MILGNLGLEISSSKSVAKRDDYEAGRRLLGDEGSGLH